MRCMAKSLAAELVLHEHVAGHFLVVSASSQGLQGFSLGKAHVDDLLHLNFQLLLG